MSSSARQEMPGQVMACRICRTPLNTYQDTDGIEPASYRHPHRSTAWDHQPDPVPMIELDDVTISCDFCSDRYPLVVVGTERITSAIPGGDIHNFGTTWAACAACALDLDNNRLTQLTGRALRRLRFSRDSREAFLLRALHAGVGAGLRPGRALITGVRWPRALYRPGELPATRDHLVELMGSRYRLPTSLEQPGIRAELAMSLQQATLYWADLKASILIRRTMSSDPAPLSCPALPTPHGLLLWAKPLVTGHHGLLDAVSWTVRDDQTIGVTVYRAFGGNLPSSTRNAIRDDIGWLLPVQHTTLTTQVTTSDPARPLTVLGSLIAQGHLSISTDPTPDRSSPPNAERIRPGGSSVHRVRVVPAAGSR
ncbi:hypothetical protein [Cryptosporangium sp. NPDC048952]|uniref:hypothetical protein n=1 Tax=Cryptosporangium sp. NPDC048952 TaxID=3363961 RepID=UPI003723821D